jgi:Flp pilus assembly protein TadG
MRRFLETLRLHFRRRRGGNSVIEAVLVFPLLLALMFGTTEYGYYFYVKHTLEGAAREGARVGIMPSGDDTQIRQNIINYLSNAGLQSGTGSLDARFTLTISPSSSTVASGSPLNVTIATTWSSVGAGYRPLHLIPANQSVAGHTTMRKE